MKATFIIGNGFDLNLNMKTSYINFLNFYTVKRKKSDVSAIRDFIKYLEEKDGRKNWADLEMLLGELTEKYDDSNINDYYAAILDLRRELVNYLSLEEKHYKYKISKIRKEWIDVFNYFLLSTKYLWPDDELFDVEHIDKMVIDFVILNYTRIIDKMFYKMKHKYRSKKYINLPKSSRYNKLGDIMHIHGICKKYPVFGVNDKSQIINVALQNNVDLHNYIIKSSQIRVFGRNAINFSERIKDSDIVYLYGVSLGNSDKKYWEDIYDWLKNNSNKKMIIIKYVPNINEIDVPLILNKNDAILNTLRENLKFDKNIIDNQVNVFINTKLFDFPKRKRDVRHN